MNDIDIVEAARNDQSLCVNSNEKAIDRVVQQLVSMNIGANAIIIASEGTIDLETWFVEIGFFETIRRSAHRRARAARNQIVCDGRS